MALPAPDLTSVSFETGASHLRASLVPKAEGIFPAMLGSLFAELLQEPSDEYSGVAFWRRAMPVSPV